MLCILASSRDVGYKLIISEEDLLEKERQNCIEEKKRPDIERDHRVEAPAGRNWDSKRNSTGNSYMPESPVSLRILTQREPTCKLVIKTW